MLHPPNRGCPTPPGLVPTAQPALSTWISVLPPSSRRIASRMLSWKIFSFLVFMMRSATNLVAPSRSSRHWTAAIADQSWSWPAGEDTDGSDAVVVQETEHS